MNNTKPNLQINNALFLEEAIRLRLPVKYLKEIKTLQIKLGHKYYYVSGYGHPHNFGAQTTLSNDKYIVNQILTYSGFPMAKAICITKKQFENFNWNLGTLKYPLVVKPTFGTWGGEGVLCNIKSKQILFQHLSECFKQYEVMSVEEFHGGLKHFRIFAFKNKILAILERKPASIIGDGKHTIEDLMAIENERRKKYIGKLPVADLPIDTELAIRLDEVNLTLKSIPKKGKVIELCYKINTLSGGTTIGLKKNAICKENATLILRALKRLNLNSAGFDLACEDLAKPIIPLHTNGIIIEVNCPSDLTLYELPFKGERCHVARYLLKQLIRRHLISYIWIRIKYAFGFK